MYLLLLRNPLCFTLLESYARPSNRTSQMTYQQLQPGDIRQPGDEVRAITKTKGFLAHPDDAFCAWRPVSLLSHPILPADLANAEFRRPLP